jgi:DNA-binding protein H-NS
VKTQINGKKLPPGHGPIINIDQQDISIVARAPHEEAQHWDTMSVDDLWRFHETIVALITKKIHAETQRLENRLRLLRTTVTSKDVTDLGKSRKAHKPRKRNRRPYPEVKPKYRDHSNPSVTWSGRGKVPRWLSAQIRLGKQLDDFRIG